MLCQNVVSSLQVNVSNIANILQEMFQENVVRGRGLVARSVIQAQAASPMFSHVYAALVAIINTKFPQTGELIAKRLIVRFRRAFRRNDKVSGQREAKISWERVGGEGSRCTRGGHILSL